MTYREEAATGGLFSIEMGIPDLKRGGSYAD